MKYPIGIQSFEKIRREGYVYVDKTALILVKTKDFIYIFEFKYDRSADIALQQIEEKGYAKPFTGGRQRIYEIGVNFSRTDRCIDDWKIGQ